MTETYRRWKETGWPAEEIKSTFDRALKNSPALPEAPQSKEKRKKQMDLRTCFAAASKKRRVGESADEKGEPGGEILAQRGVEIGEPLVVETDQVSRSTSSEGDEHFFRLCRLPQG